MPRNDRLYLHITLEEKQRLKRNAIKEGLNTSDYIRTKLNLSLVAYPLNTCYNYNNNNGSS
jgi:hypothetical protein